MKSVKVQLRHVDAKVPRYAHYGDAAADLYSVDNIIIPSRGRALVSTGLAFEFEPDMLAEIRPRSGLSKDGVLVVVGTVDSSYRGVVSVNVYNFNDKPFQVEVGTRIAQIAFVPVHTVDFYVVKTLSDTTRGTSGFGSTGR